MNHVSLHVIICFILCHHHDTLEVAADLLRQNNNFFWSNNVAVLVFRKNSIQQLSISFVIIPVEATRIVYKTHMFDVDERIIALQHSDY